eukprot:CAMPEP_0172796738 /NCGR_PEP_ID=MMETSP1074-20121228/211136_1 /TAXON_ID=2916 /ORGANISM="Ceratium fusus, Strain PA161109" /LENGTH=98 /DNA_ID=CAMNT_0013633831 /DNA_START=462 /DNA_END=759 /DNA_ORIENTATION=+
MKAVLAGVPEGQDLQAKPQPHSPLHAMQLLCRGETKIPVAALQQHTQAVQNAIPSTHTSVQATTDDHYLGASKTPNTTILVTLGLKQHRHLRLFRDCC